MKRNTQSATRSLGRSILALAATMLTALSAHASWQTIYWDTNGTTGGAGTTPDGIWSTSASNWNTVADGGDTGTIRAFENDDHPVFSAGGDAETATITVQGNTIYVRNIHFDEGSYTMVGNSPDLRILDGSSLTVDSDASVLFESSLPVQLVGSGTRNWTINGEARFEGTVTGSSGDVKIEKNGSGTLVFDGNVSGSFLGLDVNAGTAIVNGSWSGSQRFDVNETGTLGGTGTITLSQTLYNEWGGTIAPGDSTGDRIGTLNVTGTGGNVYFNNGTVNLEVGTTADKLAATGTLTVESASTANVTNLGGIAITQASSYTLIEAASGSGMNSNLSVIAADPWEVASQTATELVISLDASQDRGNFNVQGVFTEFDLGTAQATGYIDLLGMQTETAYGLYLDIVGDDLSNLTGQLTADGISYSVLTDVLTEGNYNLMLSLNSGTTTHEYLVWDFSDFGGITLAGFALIPEPTSFALLGLGVLALMRRPRRRRTA
jgi:hypothetical protein